MNISELQIDAFGVWTGLRLDDFKPGLNVIYGPNEAGKTTLLEFLRSMLYGFAPARQRYVHCVEDRKAGGMLALQTLEGHRLLSRHADDVRLTDENGTQLDSSRLIELLAGVDERTYNHVFAVGLEEIQELAVLDDSGAARLLYDLTTGLDRVVLGDVMRELAASRRRLLDGDDSHIIRLLQQRKCLQQEIAALADLTPRYARAVRQREQLNSKIALLEGETSELTQQVRLLETAISLRDKWSQRAVLDQELLLAGDAPRIPAGAIERLETIMARRRSRKRRYEKLRRQRQALRELARELPVRDSLVGHAAKIEAACHQQEWIRGLERRGEEIQRQSAEIETRIAVEKKRLAIDAEDPDDALQGVDRRTLATLKPLARALEQSRQHLEQLRRQESSNRESAAQRESKLHTALAQRPQPDLVAAVQDAGERVSQLRRRVQLDQRIEQMRSHQQELEDQSADLLERQMLPLWVVVALGGVFVLGVVLILAGWWLSFGWAVAVLGVAGIMAAVFLKQHLEKAAEQQLENSEKQLTLLKRQLEQANQERGQLDEELPQGGGPLLMRLEQAEAELARLEDLMPLDAEQGATARDTAVTQCRLQEAEAVCQAGQKRWQDALTAAGLPDEVSPQQVCRASGSSRRLRQLQQQLDRLRNDDAEVRQALQSFGDRISQLLADVGLTAESESPTDQIRQLRKELAEHLALLQRRRELAAQDRRLRRRQRRHQSSLTRLARHRRRLFERAGALDEADFRRRVAKSGRLSELRSSRETLQREIAAALGTQYTEESLRPKLASLTPDKLEAEWEQLSHRLAAGEAALKEHFEQRGQLNHEIDLLAADRRLPELQLELGMVHQQLKDSVRQWQVRALAGSILESVRIHYERDRQPQTLQDASHLLREMTAGRYARVWTPMDEDRLVIDDAEGRGLAVEMLSRGTREQLFLSLRLALVREYAGRGVRLPVILDDVLVNFDAARAKAAADVLADFAAGDQQVFIFTCHEHMVRLLRGVRASVIELPDRHELRLDEPEPSKVKRPRSRRKPAATRSASVAAAEAPILLAVPLPELPRAKPLEEELPPLPINGSEAEFADFDSVLPLNHEPLPRPRPTSGASLVENAEEFSGEFATRPSYEE